MESATTVSSLKHKLVGWFSDIFLSCDGSFMYHQRSPSNNYLTRIRANASPSPIYTHYHQWSLYVTWLTISKDDNVNPTCDVRTKEPSTCISFKRLLKILARLGHSKLRWDSAHTDTCSALRQSLVSYICWYQWVIDKVGVTLHGKH